MDALLAFGFMPGMGEMLIVGVIALLLFGKRLPEVARSLGKGIVEFKKGVSGIETEVDRAVYSTSSSSASRPAPHDDRDQVSAPKFEPPTSEPADAEARTS
ncbi:MAG: twin-arginine translocase TatA/TatE family subunit [Planctomycetaceae bacterium]